VSAIRSPYGPCHLCATLIGLLTVIGCQAAAPVQKDKMVELSPEAATGQQLFVSKGCVACHRAPGVPEAVGTVGPNLRGVGNTSAHPKIAGTLDNTPDNLKRWLMNPSGAKPGTSMPSLGLTDAEATSLTTFLETLK
jgi:cytochrome c2